MSAANDPNRREKHTTVVVPFAALFAKATATITCATNANMADSDYITIDDGVRAVSYEYDKSANGVTAGRASWAAGAGTAAQTAATLKTAIEANQTGITVTDNADGTLTLTANQAGTAANKTITENVAHASCTVSGFSGGTDPLAGFAATAALKLCTAERAMRLDRAEVLLNTAVTGHASNYWEIAVKAGSTVMAQWSTDSDVAAQGSITADTFTDLVNAAAASRAVADGDVISLALTKNGSAANLSRGMIALHFSEPSN